LKADITMIELEEKKEAPPGHAWYIALYDQQMPILGPFGSAEEATPYIVPAITLFTMANTTGRHRLAVAHSSDNRPGILNGLFGLGPDGRPYGHREAAAALESAITKGDLQTVRILAQSEPDPEWIEELPDGDVRRNAILMLRALADNPGLLERLEQESPEAYLFAADLVVACGYPADPTWVRQLARTRIRLMADTGGGDS
jgi:hypothetical protein